MLAALVIPRSEHRRPLGSPFTVAHSPLRVPSEQVLETPVEEPEETGWLDV
jgi:hypothetical protein